MKNQHFFLLIILFAAFACADNEDNEPAIDPLIGTWSIEGIEQDGQTFDVKEEPCIQDSKLIVDEGNLTLNISAPAESGTATCQTEILSSGWENDNGTYYTIENNDRQPANFSFSENNTRLRITIKAGNTPLTLLFRK
ncbi:hypothetical protein J2X69_000389 [Algoriphagus sp. 4150]|uniref:hypothetical protein n=1 Tax=Algoriphagus sp. 4150 TaxID=2817756 RepID=UPI00285B9140|nr:hypothetical protein [Algoriphagus sp. 4150]MDR7128061.1 hypothetical protein [Algoriphagus sp. 4150]